MIGPFVEILGDIVRRGADQLDAAIVRLLVRPRPLKASAGTSDGC